MRHIPLSFLLLLPLACSSPSDPRAGFETVQSTLSTRTHHQVQWNQSTDDDRAVDARIDTLLAQPLTPDTAVTVSLLYNRSLQAQYESLGLAQSDLVQAGLLDNPTLDLSAQFPTSSSGRTKLDGNLSQSIISLFFIPLRKKLAAAELQQAQLRVANSIIDVIRDTEVAYYALAAREQQLSLQRQLVEATEASLILSRRQHEAGTINDLRLATDESDAARARLDLQQSELSVQSDRESLNRLMGLPTPPSRWSLAPSALPDIPNESWDPKTLESRALARRLDLLAARAQVSSAETALSLAKKGIWTNLTLGAGFERDTDGTWTVGPNLSVDLPIFDHGQARLPRYQSLLRQSQRHLQSLEATTLSDLRLALAQLESARRTAETYATLAPHQHHLYELTVEQYNAMTLNTRDLLESRRADLTTQQSRLAALKDYWTARSTLTKAAGGSLPPPITAATRPTSQSTPAPSTPFPSHSHHH